MGSNAVDSLPPPATLLHRALLSVACVSPLNPVAGLTFKSVTFLNLLLKGSMRQAKRLIKWPLHDCVVGVKFHDFHYSFHCPKGMDSIVFMNPYFHEHDVTSLVCRILRDGDTFIDVGAHAGLYTLIAGKKVGGTGRVISVEPNPENLRVLRANVQLNNLRNIRVVDKAAGDAKRTIRFYYSLSDTALTSALRSWGKGQREPIAEQFDAETTTLDDIYLESINPKNVKIVKVDTEGYDLRVLEGAKRMLSKTRYVVVEENTKDVVEFLRRNDYRVELLQQSRYLLGTNTDLTRNDRDCS